MLAKAVLRGKTRGYRNHPQLERFRAHPSPLQAINSYLAAVHDQPTKRDYRFDRSKLEPVEVVAYIDVNSGQMDFEWQHLRAKLAQRAPDVLAQWGYLDRPVCHPLFQEHPGEIASWERA